MSLPTLSPPLVATFWAQAYKQMGLFSSSSSYIYLLSFSVISSKSDVYNINCSSGSNRFGITVLYYIVLYSY